LLDLYEHFGFIYYLYIAFINDISYDYGIAIISFWYFFLCFNML
jgi:hypothetical protein